MISVRPDRVTVCAALNVASTAVASVAVPRFEIVPAVALVL